MAGTPLMRKLEADIANKPNGEEWVFEQIADGAPIGDIAKALGISRRFLYMWKDREGREDRRTKWATAVRMSAEAEVEKAAAAMDVLDRMIDTEDGPRERSFTSAEVQLATGRVKYRTWLAARKDPERYGDKTTTEVNVNFGQQHLAALQDAKRLRAPVLVAIPARVEDEDTEDFAVVEDVDGLEGLM